MKKGLVVLVFVMLATLLHVSSVAQTEGGKIRLAPREVSLGKVHPGIVKEALVASPDSKRFAYVAERGGKEFVVVDGVEGNEYDDFLRGSKLVFDSPKLLHTLAGRGREYFRVEIEIREE